MITPSRATTAPTFGDTLPASLLHLRARSMARRISSLSLYGAGCGRVSADFVMVHDLPGPVESPGRCGMAVGDLTVTGAVDGIQDAHHEGIGLGGRDHWLPHRSS